jgi:lipopolysaccharide export system protein LptA
MKGKEPIHKIWMIMGQFSVATVFIFFLFVIVSGASAWGQPAPSLIPSKSQPAESASKPGQQGEPIHIIADRLEVDTKARQAQFIGHVRAQQGDVTLYSDTLMITYVSEKPQEGSPSDKKKAEQFLALGREGERIEKIIARGKVRLIQGDRTAEGDEAIFFSEDRKIVLTGNPVIRQARDHISGERVTVFLDKDLSIVEGKGDSRVQAVIYPEKGLKGPPGERK